MAPPTTTGTSSFPTVPLVAPCARTNRAQIGRPIAVSSSRSRHGPVDEDSRDASRVRLRYHQLAEERHWTRVGARQDKDVAGIRVRHDRMHHRVVAGCTERYPRWACDTRAGHDLGERDVDDARLTGGLVDRRDAESGQGRVVGHSDVDDDGDLALEGLGVADVAPTGDSSRMVGAVLRALRVVLDEIALRAHRLHRGHLLVPHGRDVEEGGGDEAAELGLVWLEEQQLGWWDRLERARDAGAACELARLEGGLVRNSVVGVERVACCVGEDQVRLELADQIGQAADGARRP